MQRWQQAEQQLQPLEDKLSYLTDRGSDVLHRLASADERQAHAVSEVEARLSEWHATERRLHQDSLDRIRTLERTIEQEWRALRGMHEEPLRLLREQAAALGETSMAAASLSLRGYERAEARLSALETDLRAQLTQLSRDIHSALAEVKAATMGAPAALPAPAAAPFPLDRVMRIHDGLRESTAQPAPSAPVPSTESTAAVLHDDVRQLPAAASALSQRVDVLERELTQERQDMEDAAASAKRSRRYWRVAAAAIVVGVAAVGVLGWRLNGAMNQAMSESAARAAAAEQQAAEADREIAAARAETAAARDAARRAELLSSVLAAPDLLRFAMAGVGQSSGSRGQVMWSRSNGLVVSISALPPAPDGAEYHVWLLSPGQPARVGKLEPDASGRATLVATTPDDVPRPVAGVAVTLESAGSTSPVPVGLTVLSRPPAAEP